MRVEFHIDGMEQLDRKLKALPVKVAQRVVRKSVRDAHKIMLNAVRTMTLTLPVSQRMGGAMKAAIAKAWELRVPRRQVHGSYALQVRLKVLPEFFSKSRKTGKTSYIPAAIEYGHGPHADGAARPYARPAADMSAPLVQAVLAHDLGKGIEAAAMESA